MSKKINYLADRRKVIEEGKRKNIVKSDKFEEHHLIGRINSDEILSLPKEWHDFITHSQNSVFGKYRKNPEIMGLSSLIGLNDLVGKQMRILRELKINSLEVENGQNN